MRAIKAIQTVKGFGLIEVLVAMSLGTMVSLGVYHAYSTLKPHFIYQANLAHIQENMRMVDVLIANKIRHDAHLGVSGKKVNDFSYDFLYHFAFNGKTDLRVDIKPGSDILKITHFNDEDSLYLILMDTKRQNQQGAPIYAIYQYSKAEGRSELIEGVEQLEFMYGIPSKEDMTYYPFDLTNDVTQIKMLRIRVVLASLDNKINKSYQQDIEIEPK